MHQFEGSLLGFKQETSRQCHTAGVGTRQALLCPNNSPTKGGKPHAMTKYNYNTPVLGNTT